jgi:hypothetical protein
MFLLDSLLKDYLLLTIEYRKAVARRMTLSVQNCNEDIIKSAWEREKDISKTLMPLRSRIKIERLKEKDKFNSNIAKLISSVILEIYFDSIDYIKGLKETSNEELWAMIKSVDNTLSNNETKEVLSNLIKIRG